MEAGLSVHNVDIFILFFFMEMLSQNGQSNANMLNYMTALRTHHIILMLDTTPFKYECMPLYLKLLRFQALLAPARHSTVSIQLFASDY